MAASDDDTRSEVSEILASCDNTSPKKKEADLNSETSSDPFEVIIFIQFKNTYYYQYKCILSFRVTVLFLKM